MDTTTSGNGSARKGSVIATPKSKRVAAKEGPENRGRTIVADSVISEIARMAAAEIHGVFQIGESGISGVLDRFSKSPGVESSVGNREAALTIDVVLSYGHSLREVTENLRRHVIERVETLSGRKVVSVDINVVDVNVVAPAKPSMERVLE